MAVHGPKGAQWFDPGFSFAYDNTPMYNSGETPKRHSACDECRQKKLKCSGELTGCTRCIKQGLLCHYSIQKQMGRPPKAKPSLRTETGDAEDQQSGFDNVQDGRAAMEQMNADATPDPIGTYEASRMCPSVYKSFMMESYHLRPGPFVTNEPIFESPGDDTTFSDPVPVPEWQPKLPDYSQINPPMASQSLPSPPSADSNINSNSGHFSPPQSLHGSQGPGSPSCSCLSQLYLCLSSLSTLSSFPLSSQTLATLYNAARTARSVIHCTTCPQAFGTGIQNLMMLGTLLTVTGDAWYRVSAMDAEVLGRETVCASYLDSVPTEPTLRQQHWRKWLHDVVRHGVVGASVAPAVHAVQSQCLDSLDLLSLIEELEDRQRICHAVANEKKNKKRANGNENGNFGGDVQMGNDISQVPAKPDGGTTDERDYLCMRIIGNARTVIERFGFEPEDLKHRETRTRTRLGRDAFVAWTAMVP